MGSNRSGANMALGIPSLRVPPQTVAVGLCNGKQSLKAINWKMVIWCMFGWLLTLPIAGSVAAVALAFGAGAPNFGPGYPDPVPS